MDGCEEGQVPMPMLEGFRKLFGGRRKPVAIDLDTEDGQLRSTSDQTGTGTGAGPGTGAGANELSPMRPERPKQDLQRGMDEIMSLVRRVGDHLDSQSQRTEKLLTLAEDLPQALQALPEINRQNGQLLETLSEHLRHGSKREQALNETLRSLSESSSQHTHVLGLLQQQFDASTQAAQQMTETLGSFSKALTDLAATNSRSTDILARIVDDTEQRESRMAAMVQRSERWNWIIVSLLGVGVLLLAVIGLLMVNQPAG
jgi:chromosome segregation ATPase